MLGPLLFLVYVNDLPACVNNSSVSMFADDIKCGLPIQSLEVLQEDLNSLAAWSRTWKLGFKVPKCVHLPCSTRKLEKLGTTYTLNGAKLGVSNDYKDLGVLIASDLCFSSHYNYIVARAYRALGLLRRTFSSLTNTKEKKSLYISLVRSQVMYCSVLWRPYLLKDITLLERVQRRATKYILNDFTSDYRSRLVALGMLPLMYTLELQDIIFTVRCLKCPSGDFNLNEYFHFSSTGTRSSAGLKMSHRFAATNSAKHFYFNRLPRLWNSLPPIDISLSVDVIKSQVIKCFYSHFLDNFESNTICRFHFLCPCSKCGHLSHPPMFSRAP